MGRVLVMHHSWREPARSTRELSESEDRLVAACIPDLLAFSSFDPHDQSQTALLFVERPDSIDVIGAWSVAGALRLATMLEDTIPGIAQEIRERF